eukprot:1018373-Pelagomonas_calceolata.AAC.6
MPLQIIEEVKITEQQTLVGLIDKIFDKALTDTHFSELYARMCKTISAHPQTPKGCVQQHVFVHCAFNSLHGIWRYQAGARWWHKACACCLHLQPSSLSCNSVRQYTRSHASIFCIMQFSWAVHYAPGRQHPTKQALAFRHFMRKTTWGWHTAYGSYLSGLSGCCECLCLPAAQFPNPEGGKDIDVRRLLLNKCQEEFESGTQGEFESGMQVGGCGTALCRHPSDTLEKL